MSKNCPRCDGFMYLDSYEEIVCVQCGNRIYPKGINPIFDSRVSLPTEGKDNFKRNTASL